MGFEHIPLSKEQAMAEIQGILGEISQMGANDSEFNALRDIQTKLQKDEIGPEDAVRQARGVRDSKSSYH